MVDLPLAGSNALVTGVSRRRGIGFAISSRLAAMGASLALHHHRPHDHVEYGENNDLDRLYEELRGTLGTSTTHRPSCSNVFRPAGLADLTIQPG